MGTVLVLIILAACVTAIILSMIKKHKTAKKNGTCSCGCSGCSKNCH